MKYLWIFVLILLFGCKNTENKSPISNENNSKNTDWIVGKWKIYGQPFDFFPFEYDYKICQLNKDAIIEFKNDHQFFFLNQEKENCKIEGTYSLNSINEINQPNSYWLKIKFRSKNYVYSIKKNENNSAIIHSYIYPRYILKHIDITEDDIFSKYEKPGFEIKIQKIK